MTMTWSQPQSSPTAFSFASSPLAPPTRPRIPSAMSEYSSPQPAAPCAALLSSPTASSTSRGNFSRRRSQYKSRSPTSSSAAASSPLLFDRWHDRLLQSCAQRVKENRQQSLQQSRSGFQCEERTEHFSEEEQAIASRIYARDEARRRQALEHEFQLQQFDTITEQDLQELGMQDSDEAPPEDFLEEEAYSRHLSPAEHADADMVPSSEPACLTTALLASPCPNCTSSPLATEPHDLGCYACHWSIPLHLVQSNQPEVDHHVYASNYPPASHGLSFSYSSAVGLVATCSCGDIFVLD